MRMNVKKSLRDFFAKPFFANYFLLLDRYYDLFSKIANFQGFSHIVVNYFADQGTSKIEPGKIPRANMTLSFYTWTEFEKNCGYSRLYGGVNFPDSVANIKDMAAQMGRRAIDFVRYHVNLANGKKDGTSLRKNNDDNSSGQMANNFYMYSRERSQYRIKRQLQNQVFDNK